MIYKWLKHNAFKGDSYRRFSWLRVVFGFLDFRPNLIRRKIELTKDIRGSNLPKIGHIHVPKTGGSYTGSLRKQFPHVSFNHVVVRSDRSDSWCPVGMTPISPKKIKGYYIYSTVRNPLLFLISYYHHVLGNKGFENTNHYDYLEAVKGFENLVNVIISRESIWPSKKFLFPNLFDQSGNIVANWVNRNEVLDEDLSNLLNSFHIHHVPIEKKRVSKKNPPESYYSTELLDKVEETYKREIEFFGYKGFGFNEPPINLHEFKNSKLKYFYQTDTLVQGEYI
jgi:hypothetical protein